MNKIVLLTFLLTQFILSCKTEEIVSEPKRSDTYISNIELKSISGASITYDSTINTYTISVPSGTDPTSLIVDFEIPNGATSSPAIDIPQDFSQPVTYTITAEDGSKNVFTIKIQALSSENNILSFVFSEFQPEIIAYINDEKNEITAMMSPIIDLTSLQPTIIVSEGATISPLTTKDFTNPVIYTVTAVDGKKRNYTVTIIKENLVSFSDDIIVFGSRDANIEGNLIALNAKNGSLKWYFHSESQIDSSPNYYNGFVFCNADSKINAINANDGSLRWKIGIDGLRTPSPTVYNSKLIFGDIWGTYVVDALTGSEIDRFEIGSTINPLIHNEYLYFGKGTIRSKLNGQLKESEYFATYVETNRFSTPKINNEIFYSISKSRIEAWDLKNDKYKQGFNLNSTSSSNPSSITINNQILYCSAGDNYLYALEADSFNLLWKKNNSFGRSSPFIYEDKVYIGSLNGGIYALNSRNGDTIWSYPSRMAVFASPVVYNGVVYVGSNDGVFYALDANTGTLIWSYNTYGSISSSACVITKEGNVIHSSLSGNSK